MRELAAVPPLTDDEQAWVVALDAMELHLDEIRGGLEAACLPSPYQVHVPDTPMPPALGPRAQRLLAAQHDVEEELRERMAVLGSVLRGTFGGPPAPVFVDERG